MQNVYILDPAHLGGYAPLLGDALEELPEGKLVLLGYGIETVACGVLAAVQQGNTMVLSWLCVATACQGLGVSDSLLEALVTVAEAQEEVTQLECTFCLPQEDRMRMEGLLSDWEFEPVSTDKTFSLSLAAVERGPIAPYLHKPRGHVAPFSQLRSGQWAAFRSGLLERHTPCPRGTFARLLPEVSQAWVEEDEITACVLFEKSDEDVELRWLCGNGEPQALVRLLAAAANELHSQFGEVTIHMAAIEPKMEELIRKLGGDSVQEEAAVCTFRRSLT